MAATPSPKTSAVSGLQLFEDRFSRHIYHHRRQPIESSYRSTERLEKKSIKRLQTADRELIQKH
jgi:hypothetical protein